MKSRMQVKAELRAKVPKQAWLVGIVLSLLGIAMSAFFSYQLVERISIDERFRNHRITSIGEITDMEHVKGRKEGYWHPKVTVSIPQRGKVEIDDVYLRIAESVNAGAALKSQYVGRSVEVEYLPDFSSARVTSSYSNDRSNQIGYGLLLVALGILLSVPLALIWWKPQWAIEKNGSHVSNHAKSKFRKRHRK